MSLQGLLLEPLDVLFFRSSRPEDPVSVLPHPQTLAGALRTALLAAHGIAVEARREARDKPIRDVLAARGVPAAVLDARFAGPFLVRDGGAVHQALLPAPRTLFRSGNVLHRAWPAIGSGRADLFLREAVRSGGGLAPLWLGGAVEADAKPVADFVTLASMRRFLGGELLEVADLVPACDLFEHDRRVGVGIDPEALVAEKGILYTTSFLALAPGVSLYAEIDAPEEVARKLEGVPMRFGGEGRRVVVRRIDAIEGGVPAWSVAPTGDRALVVSISPGSYDGALPPVLGDRVRAASVGRPWAHSGWERDARRSAADASAGAGRQRLVRRRQCSAWSIALGHRRRGGPRRGPFPHGGVAMTAFTGGLLVLHAETPLHPGAGTALGVVDLPVQRERHTQFPIIPGTALKGVLRDAARRPLRTNGKSGNDANDDARVVSIFGGAPGSGNPEAGAISVSDARLLALPVRSLKGVFAWVTCAQILERLARDAHLVGLDLAITDFVASENQAIVAPDSSLVADDKRVVLEEFDFEVVADEKKRVAFAGAAKNLSDKLLPSDAAFATTRARFERSLCLIADNDFAHFAQHSTEIVARIGLNTETKTANRGALFYQELLPADSVFYAVIIAEAVRAKGGENRPRETWGAAQVLDKLRNEVLPAYLQVGADESTGRGFCATRFAVAGDAQ